jgi:UDP-glucose/GDP-mannose dehydrogenase family, UDP binding domain
MDQAHAQLPDVTLCADPYECARGAGALVIATEWDSSRALDFKRLAELMASPSIVDLRNVYRPEDVRRRGFRYVWVADSYVGSGNERSDQIRIYIDPHRVNMVLYPGYPLTMATSGHTCAKLRRYGLAGQA